MRCWSCQREIPDGSRFCGLCGAKQGREASAQTLAGAAARAPRAATRTLVSGPREDIVSSGGHRFAALSQGPAPVRPEAEVTDTLSEGVPAGALAGLLAARRTQPKQPVVGRADAPIRADLLRTAPNRPATPGPDPAETSPEFLASAPPLDEATPAPSPSAASLSETAPELLASAPPPELSDATAPDRPSAAVSVTARERVERPEMPSVIVDSQLSREAAVVERQVEAEAERVRAEAAAEAARLEAERVAAAAAKARAAADAAAAQNVAAQNAAAQDAAAQNAAQGPAPANRAPTESPADAPTGGDAAGKARGFRETAWFMDALDADALSAGEQDDARARHARYADGGPLAVDSNARKRFSLRTQDELPAQPEPTDFDQEPTSARDNRAVVSGLIGVIFIALGVAGWFLFVR